MVGGHGNSVMGDVVIISPNFGLNHKISLETVLNVVIFTFTDTGNIGLVNLKTFTIRPCFCTVM